MPDIPHYLRRESSLQARGRAFRDRTESCGRGKAESRLTDQKMGGRAPVAQAHRSQRREDRMEGPDQFECLGCDRDQVLGLFVSGASEDCEAEARS